MRLPNRFEPSETPDQAAFLQLARRSAAQIAATGDGADPAFAAFEEELLFLLIEYGVNNNSQPSEALETLFQRSLTERPQVRRVHWVLCLSTLAERRMLGVVSLTPFLLFDTDMQVVATAALNAACLWQGDDGLAGVRQLTAWAKAYAQDGNGQRAAAFFGGLLSLGDRRAIECVGECWRLLSDSDASILTKLLVTNYAGVIDWLMSWIEQCEGAHFGTAAAALSSVGRQDGNREVIDIQRAMPAWTAPEDQVVTVLDKWSLEAYGDRIRPRLLQVAADEQSPRIMHYVLKFWEIDHTRRHVPGVAMRSGHLASVPSHSLEAKEGPSQLLPEWHPLQDTDFVMSKGELLLCWAIFNPYGPTWCCIGVLPTARPEMKALFYRCLNPFVQQSGIMGFVHERDLQTGATIGEMIESLFRQEAIVAITGAQANMIGGGLPDVVAIVWNDTAFEDSVLRAFLGSPVVKRIDVARVTRDMEAFPGRPLERAAMQRDEEIARLTREGILPLPVFGEETSHETISEWLGRASAAFPTFDGTTSSDIVREWFGRVMKEEHWVAELVHFPIAWHGAIDHAGQLGQTAYTYWQLDAFLVSYGYSMLRKLADLRATERTREEPAP